MAALFQQEVTYLLENGFSVPSSNAWSSLCLLVPKTDKTPRFCTDFCKVNEVTKADSYPLPYMEDCVDRVGSAKLVTKLDLLNGYCQVPLTPVHLRLPLSSPQAVSYTTQSCHLASGMHQPLSNVSCTSSLLA